MPVRKHGRGWEVRVQSAGRRFSKTVGNRQDAFALERTVRARITDSQLGRTPRYSLEEALTRWLTGEAASLRSIENLKDKVRVIYPFAQGKDLTEIVSVADKVRADGMKRGLKPATINRRLAVLRRVARLAFRKWEPAWLDRDLGSRIALLPGEEPRYEQATPEEVQRLIRAAGRRVGAVIEFAALTGLRRGELLSLTPEHLRDGAIVLTRTKTGRPRIVPLADGMPPFPFGITGRELTLGFDRARKKTGLAYQFRDLRRTFGSWIVQRTKSIKAAQELLGHTTSTITSKHYAHLLEGNLREAVGTLPTFHAGQTRGRGNSKNALKNRKKAA